jgi:hypothetical protein
LAKVQKAGWIIKPELKLWHVLKTIVWQLQDGLHGIAYDFLLYFFGISS